MLLRKEIRALNKLFKTTTKQMVLMDISAQHRWPWPRNKWQAVCFPCAVFHAQMCRCRPGTWTWVTTPIQGVIQLVSLIPTLSPPKEKIHITFSQVLSQTAKVTGSQYSFDPLNSHLKESYIIYNRKEAAIFRCKCILIQKGKTVIKTHWDNSILDWRDCQVSASVSSQPSLLVVLSFPSPFLCKPRN